jgi:hypothetical protein
MDNPIPTPARCHHCGSPLECFEAHQFCPDCERYTLADPPRYRDDGVLYRPVCLLPYCELVPGSRYALPGCQAVRVKAPSSTPEWWDAYPGIARAVANRPVLLLERVEGDDEILDLVDDSEPPF